VADQFSKPSTILVPTDFSEPADRARRYALMLAEGFGATLHILHVLPEAHDVVGGINAARWAELMEHARRSAEEQLNTLLTTDQHAKVRAEVSVAFGRPAAKIIEYTKDNAIDLIVLGSHGRGAIEKWWFGSVAQGVLLRASCPVVIVRPPHEV